MDDDRNVATPGPAAEGDEIVWRLVPQTTPLVARHCPRCDKKQHFYSSDKFRINGHQSRVDVWLIYKCSECEETWKLTLHTRVRPSSIDPDLYHRMQNNDRDTAWRYAFDGALIRRCGAELADNGAFELDGPGVDELSARKGVVRLRIAFDVSLQPRLDALLSRQLSLSRRQIDAILSSGSITMVEPRLATLPKRLAYPVVLRVDLDRIAALAAWS